MLKEEYLVNKVYKTNRKKLKLPTLGFTLVELLAVVVILGIILTIAVPRIMDVIDNTRESAYEINEGMMVSAARNYLVMNESKNPSEPGTMSILTIEELQNSELISSINDAKDSNIDCDGYVVVKNVNGTAFDYTPYLKCGTNYETEGFIFQHLQSVDVLVVAGGGSGASESSSCETVMSGAGGAGGLIFLEKIEVTGLTSIEIGAGGVAPNNSGQDSKFGNFIAIGGGHGGRNNLVSGDGGSSGGGGRGCSGNPSQGAVGESQQPSSISGGYGNLGGGSTGLCGCPSYVSGGGGAGTKGTTEGYGGDGMYYGSIFGNKFGENGWFAGGGGARPSSGGGIGGGGNGSLFNQPGDNGLPNTGGGGGGGITAHRGYPAGNGGSGVVLVKYEGPPKAIGGEITSFNGYTIHAFTEVGESVFEVLEF